ncbi:uncharacterized protein [Pyrus communis]|uniref:uncharacterized protein n=1 Tax=Pyrus communis TaxID=23211 RepID=UPI0035BF26D8
MERYYKKQCLNPPSNILGSPSPSNSPSSLPPPSNIPGNPPLNILSSSQQSEATELDEILANLPADPGYRHRMLDYPPNYREAIRRHYLQNDPCQPRDHIMPRKVVFENAPTNLKYTSSDIQKDLVHACAIETINAITKDMEGEAIEKFLGVQHVSSTISNLLEETIERLFATTNLSMSTLQEQGYDGARNMRGELNGRKTKILNKYPQAFYIHCFAHQLQLALVFVAKENEDVANFFINASSLVNLIGSSSKRRDAFREKQQEQIQKALHIGNLEIGKGLNQESSLMYPCDTLWNLHYGIIVSIIVMFEVMVEVVEWIKSDRNQDNLDEATRLFKDIQTFDFAFHLFLMRLILGITNELSQAL